MATALATDPRRNVPFDVLIRAAVAVDRSGPGRADWRQRLAIAADELVSAELARYPVTRWDRATLPPLPRWLQSPPRSAVPKSPTQPAWHHRLHWVPDLDREQRLSTAERSFLMAVNNWLPDAVHALIVPLRERSWQLVGDDRALEGLRRSRLFVPGRLSLELLRCRVTWPPVQQTIHGDGRWLIVENWSTFDSLSVMAQKGGFNGRVIFGAGNQVGTRIAALTESGESPEHPVLYFGDIDAGGLQASRLAVRAAHEAGWPVVLPAATLYELALATPHRLSVPPGTASMVAWATNWMGGRLGPKVGDCLLSGRGVRQEAVGLETLSSMSFDVLVSGD
jgi:hypothetical protein